MNEFLKGDIVRRHTDNVLLKVEYADDSIACCHVVDPFVDSRKVIISVDMLSLERREEKEKP
ncbi:hypothetical protein [Aeromonas enteropelogenes]|uniref:hypothetical protein n=1 Tax=Aeromonas enteropelogenes TaxID=29489 RepID=UPI0039881D61